MATLPINELKKAGIVDACPILNLHRCNTLMSDEMIKEVKVFYANLDEHIKPKLKFQICRNCKSIEDESDCMVWLNTSLNNFVTDFGIPGICRTIV